jgi:hypothetical protein
MLTKLLSVNNITPLKAGMYEFASLIYSHEKAI